MGCLLLGLCAACTRPAVKETDPASWTLADVPGITQEKIEAVQALAGQDSIFYYGMNYSSESFYD